jgi:hypothetical protein
MEGSMRPPPTASPSPNPDRPRVTREQIAAFAAAAGAGELRLYAMSPFLVLLAERPIGEERAGALGEVIGAILHIAVEVRPLASLPAARRAQAWATARPWAP